MFRVVAGNSLGTAFAVGRESPDGTDLVTNFHVVETLYKSGGRDVALQSCLHLFQNRTTVRVFPEPNDREQEVAGVIQSHQNHNHTSQDIHRIEANPHQRDCPALLHGSIVGVGDGQHRCSFHRSSSPS